MTSLRIWSEPDEARMWLVCLPPGGGGAHMFRSFAAHLPTALGVAALELPGHGSRSAEPPASDAAALVAALAADLQSLLGRPVILFGHSMGAILAADIARLLRSERGWRPLALIAAASESPDLPLPVPELSDELLRQQLSAWGGVSPELITDREYLAELFPVLRADLTMMAARVDSAPAPLDCRVHVYLGADDAHVSQRSAIQGWARQTAVGHTVRVFPGGHFFPVQSADLLLAALAEDADVAVGGLLRRAGSG